VLPAASAQSPALARAAPPAVGIWKWTLVTAVIAAVAIALYAVMTTRRDETQSKIVALEKQLKDKDAADAERQQQAKKQAEEEARQRKAQEQVRADEEKARPEAARKPEPIARPQLEIPKRGGSFAAKSPAASASSVGPASSAAKPAPQPKETMPAPAAIAAPAPAIIVPPAPAPEPPKAAQRTPAELLGDAERALAAQRYADAITILKPLAEAGNAQAQFKLGDAYSEEQGVERDLKIATSWYEKAALQGSSGAMLKLGALYANGNGVAQNNNLAYVWYGTAARLGSGPAKNERDKILSRLQPAEREQADKLIESTIERTKKP
jgi:TPR repeat protein